MMPISGVNTGGAQPLAAAEKTLGGPMVQKPEEEARGRRLEPTMDGYAPEEPREPSGRYWMGRDEDGRAKVCFDGPEGAANAPKQPEGAPEAEEPKQAGQGAKGPEGKKDRGETWECNTDKVDREIEALKKERRELEQRLDTETGEAKIEDLERQLAQVEQELRQKDNDAYRKRNAVFTQLS